MTATHTHQGPHRLFWAGFAGRADGSIYPLRDAIEVALDHAWVDESADNSDGGVSEDDLRVVRKMLDRVPAADTTRAVMVVAERTDGLIACDDVELAAAERVIGLAAEYMDNNNYAEDEEFPEDAAAARVLGRDGSLVLDCYAEVKR